MKKRNALIGASVLVILLGLMVDYAGRDINRGIEPDLNGGGFNSDRPDIVTEIKPGTIKKAAAKGEEADKQTGRRYERKEYPSKLSSVDENAWIQEHLEMMASLEPVQWDHDPNEGNLDSPELVSEVISARSAEYDHQLQILADLDGNLPPPTGQPDEDESENLYQDLPELGEEEVQDMLEIAEQTAEMQQALEPEMPHPPGEEFLPPAY